MAISIIKSYNISNEQNDIKYSHTLILFQRESVIIIKRIFSNSVIFPREVSILLSYLNRGAFIMSSVI